MTKLARLRERAHREKVLQVSCRGSARGFGDADVIFRAEAALEAIDSFPEHTGNDFLLALVQFAAQLLVKLGLCYIEIHPLDGVALRLIDRIREIDEPVGNLDVFVVAFKGAIKSLPGPLDGVGEPY